MRQHREELIEANDAFLGLVGYTREDLGAGRLRWRDMTPPEYRALDERALQQLDETGVAPPYEKRTCAGMARPSCTVAMSR